MPLLDAGCDRCAMPLPDNYDEQALCGQCLKSSPSFIRTRAVYEYAFPVDAALKTLKFSRKLYYAPAFSADLLRVLKQAFPDVDALVPVPLHRWRYVRRGFNQAVELSRPLARATGLPMLHSVRRVTATATQSGLNAAQRRRNLAGAFRVRGRLKCSHPLIVDDVMTTGETCNQLASTLLGAGAKSVSVLVVARA
jgi:ComF family protein